MIKISIKSYKYGRAAGGGSISHESLNLTYSELPLIKIIENDKQYKDKLMYKNDNLAISKRMQNLRTEVRIGQNRFETEDSQASHDISHIIASEFFKQIKDKAKIITDKYPKIFKTSSDMFSFKPSGEILPEIFDVLHIFKIDDKVERKYLDANSDYWQDRICEQRYTDMTMMDKLFKFKNKKQDVIEEIKRIIKSQSNTNSQYDKYFESEGGLSNFINAQFELIALALSELKKEAKLDEAGHYQFNENSFGQWAFDTKNTANKVFIDGQNEEIRFQAFSSLTK